MSWELVDMELSRSHFHVWGLRCWKARDSWDLLAASRSLKLSRNYEDFSGWSDGVGFGEAIVFYL